MINPRGVLSLMPMLRFTVVLVAGIFTGDMLLHHVSTMWWFIAAVISCITGVLLIGRKMVSSFLAFMTVFFLGAMYIAIDEDREIAYTRHHLRCEGMIISEPVQKGKVVQCDILLTRGWQSHPSKVRASIRRDYIGDSLKVGTTLRWVSTVQKPHAWGGHDNHNFSYEKWMHIHDYEANVFLAQSTWGIVPIDLSGLSWWQMTKIQFLIARSRLLHKIAKMEFSKESFSVVAAMTMGDKTWLNKDMKDMYSAAGVAHILALSGMHIGIIMFLFIMLAGGRRNVKLQIIGITTVWLFILFIGMTVSAIRAALMMTLWYVLHLMRRNQHPLNVLGWVAFVLIIINPETVFDVGFQMSFIAVFFIFLCMPYLLERRPIIVKSAEKWTTMEVITQKVWIWIYSMVCISFVAQIGTLPLTICYFGRVPFYFLLTNIVILPLAVVVIYATIVLVAMMLLNISLANTMAWVINGVMQLMNGSVELVASLPGASIEGIDINKIQVLVLYSIIACAIMLIQKYRT